MLDTIILSGCADLQKYFQTVLKNSGFLGGRFAQIDKNQKSEFVIAAINHAIAQANGRYLLILSDNCKIDSESLRALRRSLESDCMVFMAAPRCLCHPSCPWPNPESGLSIEKAHIALQCLANDFPTLYVPLLQSSCALIKTELFREIELLDTSYNYWENALDDVLMRANAYGFRGVLANGAFVPCKSISRAFSCAEDNLKLNQRFPELVIIMQEFLSSALLRAEALFQTIFCDKPLALFDFSSFAATHDGTNEAGIRLIEQAAHIWTGWRIGVIASNKIWRVHKLGAIAGLERVSPENSSICATVILRIGQPWKKHSFSHLFELAPMVSIFMLDTIGYDCQHIRQYAPGLDDLWSFVFLFSDIVFTQSKFTKEQFVKRFPVHAPCPLFVTYHSLDISEYSTEENCISAEDYILVVGNSLPHKYVSPTVDCLATAFPDREIIVVGSCDKRYSNVRILSAGSHDNVAFGKLYAKSSCVIFPSMYEGFGFPILHGLGYGKHVYARRTKLTLEIAEKLGQPHNLHLYHDTGELPSAISAQPLNVLKTRATPYSGWERSAKEIIAAFEQLRKIASFSRIRDRLRIIRQI